MTKKNKRRGFTVVELVIVIAVIAILAAVLIPTYANLVKKANEAKAQAEAKNLITEMLADILLGKEGDADLLVFSEKGSDVYAYAYSRTEGKIIAYKNNPTAKTGSFEDTVQSILTAMGDAITDCNVAEDDWRHPDKIKAVVNELNTKGTMIVYANYTINADKFAVHVHSFGAWENADAENHIRRCSCGETETAKHEWESKTENNVKIDTCKVCHATKTEVISDGEKHHLFHHIAKAATCGEAGNIEYWECVDEGCGKYFRDSNATNEITDKNSVKIAQLTNHTYGAWNNTTQATCTTAGSKQRTCTVCGHTEYGTIPVTGHSWGEWTSVDNTNHKHTCKNCNKEELEAHNFVDGKCDKCGATQELTLQGVIAAANAKLAAYGKKPETMHEAMTAIGNDLAKAIEKVVAEIPTTNAGSDKNCVLWDSQNNVFCYVDNKIITYIDTATQALANKWEYWKIVTGKNNCVVSATYSNYLASNYSRTEVTTRAGLDVGSNNIKTIIVSPNVPSKDLILITSGNEKITINQATKVIHYGKAQSVTISSEKRYKSSITYIENGEVSGYLKVGRYDISGDTYVVDISGVKDKKAAKAIVLGKHGDAFTIIGNGKTPICYTSSKPTIKNAGTGNDIGKVYGDGLTKFNEGFGTSSNPFVINTSADFSSMDNCDTTDTLYFKLGSDINPYSSVSCLARNTNSVLDLNGKTITIPDGGTIQVGSKGLTIKGSGRIVYTGNSGDRGIFSFYASGTITLEGGTYSGTYLVGDDASHQNLSGTIIIKSGATVNVTQDKSPKAANVTIVRN